MEEYPKLAGPVPSESYARSFAARAEGHPALSRNLTGPSSESLLPPRYRKDVMTIRAVTPDSEADMDDNMTDSSARTQVDATPPRTPSRSTTRSASKWDLLSGRSSSPEQGVTSSPDKPKSVLSKAASSAAAQLADLSITRAKSRSPIERMRTSKVMRTTTPPEDVGKAALSETGGSSGYVARHRFGPSQGVSESGPLPSSVGYPWSQSVPVLSHHSSSRPQGSSKNKHHRLLKSQGSASALNSKSMPDPPLPPPINVEYEALVQMMKAVRGRMEGYVDFRMGSNTFWTKGYCLIDVEIGSLLYHKDENYGSTPSEVLIPDLRGCHVGTPPEDGDQVIELFAHSLKIEMKIRPLSVKQFDIWLAALLCWRPIGPAGAQNKMIKSQTSILATEKRRRNSDATVQNRGDVSFIKVGRMLLWRPQRPTTNSGPSKSSSKSKPTNAVAWENISCMLQDTGEFRLHREQDNSLVEVMHLSQLSRCAIQLLDPSILDQDFCIAIYPQYTPLATILNPARPVYLGIDTRTAFEAWFVLLRAFTMPEIYGPPPSLDLPTDPKVAPDAKSGGCLTDSYRIQRSLFVRVVEAKINHGFYPNGHEREPLDCYAEVLLDGEVRAKTMVRTKTHNPFWREDYEFPDLPTMLSDISVILKQRDPRWKTKGTGSVTGSGGFGGGLGGVSLPGSNDAVVGRIEVGLDELIDGGGKLEGWMPLMSHVKEGIKERVGELYVKMEVEELVVLMASEYKNVATSLHKFDNGLTIQLAKVITDLRRLADTLLQIYQVSNKANDWLMALAEHEIDGLHKKSLPSPETADANGTTETEQGKCLVDANILFRGNSLLTRALDSHMKRLGREYLEDTLGEHLQRIAQDDILCEVDPMKLEHADQVNKNWKMLLNIVRGIWHAIYHSPSRCPLELRKILRHIRNCVKNRYGDGTRLHNVTYSSVCGFLFLRFFCPAILNPKLFGLLKDHPGVRAQRTLTLIAKALQGLANMTTFGVKEPWMSPMNEFLKEHTDELKEFVDSVTNIPASLDKAMRVPPPAYATPITILNRLSPSSKEGFPSLPYLIDQPRAFAALVTMWKKYTNKPYSPLKSPTAIIEDFDAICRDIEARTTACIEKAEDAERPSSACDRRWEEVAERVTGAQIREGVYTTTTSSPSSSAMGRISGHSSSSSSSSSATIAATASHHHHSVTTTTSSNSSSATDMGYSAMAYSTAPGGSKSRFGGLLPGLRRKVKVGREEP